MRTMRNKYAYVNITGGLRCPKCEPPVNSAAIRIRLIAVESDGTFTWLDYEDEKKVAEWSKSSGVPAETLREYLRAEREGIFDIQFPGDPPRDHWIHVWPPLPEGVFQNEDHGNSYAAASVQRAAFSGG